MDHMLPVLPSSSKYQSARTLTPRDNTVPTIRPATSMPIQSTSPTRERSGEKLVPSRVQFVPGSSHLYGAVNCNDANKTKASTSSSIPQGRLKSGPPLLEIRRLRYCPREKSSCYNKQEQEGKEVDSNNGRTLYQHENILVSRGISGLGGNVSSTCLSFRPLAEDQMMSSNSLPSEAKCATGLTSGALCIHTISNLNDEHNAPSSTVAHYAPRQQRPVTSVAWCTSSSKNSLVAVGLTGSGVSGNINATASSSNTGGRSRGPRLTPPVMSPTASGGDRDFGCLVWDISTNTVGSTGNVGTGKGGAAVPVKTPSYKYAHNTGVESVAWLSNGQLLAVGSQKRNIQLYDMRVSGTNTTPISIFAHSEAVAGIVQDESNRLDPTTFASFGRNLGEPVKIWDLRRTDAPIGEIRVESSSTNYGTSAVVWSPYPKRQGYLTIAIGDTIKTYDTTTPGSSRLPVEVSYVGDECDYLQDLAFQPMLSSTIVESLPHRLLVVSPKGDTDVLPELHIAPLSISNRDGRIAHVSGDEVSFGNASEGPAAMEGDMLLSAEDISAKIMRRARCLHSHRYSTDAVSNVKMLEEEKEQLLAQRDNSVLEEFHRAFSNVNQLIRLWRWIALVEDLCREQRDGDDLHSSNNNINFSNSLGGQTFEDSSWTAKGLNDAGVLKLLRMSSRDGPDDNTNWMDSKSTSEVFARDEFDSPMRRAALNACGWIKRCGGLRTLLEQAERRQEYERAAALAIWHGNLGECVAALQRGAEVITTLAPNRTVDDPYGRSESNLKSYAETLNLAAMVVAGFSMLAASDGSMHTSNVWRKACENLLLRPDILAEESSIRPPSEGVAYLRAICTFLLNIGNGFDKTIHDKCLSLSDRVGVAIRFLNRADLRSFLDLSLRQCLQTGNLEGLIITGLDRRGVGIMIIQSYVDKTSDVQTAALVVSRVIPADGEKRISHEWLENYRDLLNNLQLWHSRAAFDVRRNEIIRRINNAVSNTRRTVSSKKAQRIDNEANFPPPVWARCNYCNTPLPLSKLRRQEGIVANSWLSRQKPVLNACPTCKKPLPRCSVCLLGMGCLNPYLELQRERNQYPRTSGQMLAASEDLSGLANIPFAEWFTWCMRCKHGGHAHHLLDWFSKHSTCPVSGCDCHCQFDGIQRLKRPATQDKLSSP